MGRLPDHRAMAVALTNYPERERSGSRTLDQAHTSGDIFAASKPHIASSILTLPATICQLRLLMCERKQAADY